MKGSLLLAYIVPLSVTCAAAAACTFPQFAYDSPDSASQDAWDAGDPQDAWTWDNGVPQDGGPDLLDATQDVSAEVAPANPCDMDNDHYRNAGCAEAGEQVDCCDNDPNAYPGQTAFFPTQNGCGKFDYNCDGAETPKWQWQLYCAPILICAASCNGFPALCQCYENDGGSLPCSYGFSTPDNPGCGKGALSACDSTQGCTAVVQPGPQVQECR
jgi:hypothetical protein